MISPRRRLVLGILGIFVGLPLLVGAGLYLYGGGFALFECGNQVLHEHPSPDGKLKVVVFERNCGATTPFSTQASLLAAGQSLPAEAGNIFVATTGQGPAGPGGGPDLAVSWVGPQRLVLEHHRAARVDKAEAQAAGVQIDRRLRDVP